ncbi:MAG: HAAS signaling domain-containing protein [Clostridium sp.]|uniref:HAAS signaling domain-containing protein n=1 Tax=Clostridium sp. TaxID=1506 RepID=UPI003F3EE65C
MTKKDFLNKLASELRDLPPNVVSDILFDYQDYFESKKGVLSEEDAISSLGSIDDLIKNYREENSHLIKNKKLSFTQEIPVVSENFINIDETYDYSKSDKLNLNTNKTNSSTKNKEVNSNVDDSSFSDKSKDVNSNINDTFINTESLNKNNKGKKLKKDSSPKKKITKKSFLGYLFSLPLLAITIPIGACLGISAGALYIAFIFIAVLTGLLIFGVSLIPFALSLAGMGILLVKSFSTIIFTSVPSFITEFPSIIILFFSISLLFLGIGSFSLGILFIKKTTHFISSMSRYIFNFIFKRGDLNEA